MVNEPILIILGPSGAGKTSLDKYLQEELNLLHFDFDVMERDDVIKDLGLRDEWNEFFTDHKSKRFAAKIRKRFWAESYKGASITCPGKVLLPIEYLLKLAPLGIRCVILFGTGAQCLNSFLEREKTNGRGLSEDIGFSTVPIIMSGSASQLMKITA